MRHLGLQSFNQVLSVPFDVFNLFIKFAVVFNPFLLFFQHGFLVGFQNFFLSQAFHFGHRVHKRFSFAQDFGFLFFFPFNAFALFFFFFGFFFFKGFLTLGFYRRNLVFDFFAAEFESQQSRLFFQIGHLRKQLVVNLVQQSLAEIFNIRRVNIFHGIRQCARIGGQGVGAVHRCVRADGGKIGIRTG